MDPVKHLPVLKKLCRCNKRLQKELLLQGGKSLQLCLRECALNVLKGNVPLSKHQFNRLKKFKLNLRDLSKKKTSAKKRLQIEQRGGFLASFLLPIVGSLASEVVSKVLKK
jgi:hypothetical protein